jgi:hypothetical protein
MYNEKRHFHRVAHDAKAILSHGNEEWTCMVEDLSLSGCLLDMEKSRPLVSDEVYRLNIHLTYAVHIVMDVVLAHLAGNHAGFRCVGIDSDSVAQLRRLIELNLGDSTLLERDMRELIRG